MKDYSQKPVLLAEYSPSNFLIDYMHLEIVLDTNATKVRSRMTVRRNPAVKVRRSKLVLDGELLTPERVALNGKTLGPDEYRAGQESLTLPTPDAETFTFEIDTVIDPAANTALQGLYLSRGVFCTQCEAHGFRRITYFLDRPDVLSVYTVRLEADVTVAPILLANGNPVERGTLPGGKRHYAVWHDPHPKPAYLFAVVGGNLGSIASTFKTMSGRSVDLRIYVEHGKEDRAHWAMDSLKRSMAWDEKRFGREYDLDVFNIVAVSDFNMGAMENKGLNIFNDRLVLASPETATDANYESIESVIAHEYFHNWTGNRITCRDWFQLCLKEGLTVYRDQEFSSDERSRTVQRIADVRQLRALQFPEDQGPLAHPVRPESYIEINNFYTPTVYEKGAELVRMIETIVGNEKFRASMDLYFERHDGTAATVEDFAACFEDASGISLKHFMRWYSQAGTPELVCEFSYDEHSKTAELRIEQVLPPTPGQPKKLPLYIPVRLGLVGANGQDLDLELDQGEMIGKNVIAVTKRRQSFKFKNVPSRPVPSLLRGFSAPVNLTLASSDNELMALMMHDSDLFNRWQAANKGLSKAVIGALNGASDKSKMGLIGNAIRSILDNPKLEHAYKAEIIKLPTQSDIARELQSGVDTDAIHRAHKYVGLTLANDLAPLLVELYGKLTAAGQYSPDAKSTGRRALRNACLTLLSYRGTPEDIERLEKHYSTASNMTDSYHALSLLTGFDTIAREKALTDFYRRWKNDHLVVDMWFAAQAQSPLDTTLDRIRELTLNPNFKITTPNKVRALLGTFAIGNPVQFNRSDGKGYDFIASKAIEIDRVNPQVSARLFGAFRSYKSLEPKRRKMAHAAIQRVVATATISRDLREIAERMVEP